MINRWFSKTIFKPLHYFFKLTLRSLMCKIKYKCMLCLNLIRKASTVSTWLIISTPHLLYQPFLGILRLRKKENLWYSACLQLSEINRSSLKTGYPLEKAEFDFNKIWKFLIYGQKNNMEVSKGSNIICINIKY